MVTVFGATFFSEHARTRAESLLHFFIPAAVWMAKDMLHMVSNIQQD